MKRSVGLLVMVRMPDRKVRNGNQLMACLQRRGTFNHEKMAPESFPGCLQVTCHGRLEEGESLETALIREMQEELGWEFAATYQREYVRKPISTVLTEISTTKKEVATYGVIFEIEFIRDLVRLGPDSGGLIYITAKQVECIVPITDDMKQLGSGELLAMFSDEIETVKKAFEIFGSV